MNHAICSLIITLSYLKSYCLQSEEGLKYIVATRMDYEYPTNIDIQGGITMIRDYEYLDGSRFYLATSPRKLFWIIAKSINDKISLIFTELPIRNCSASDLTVIDAIRSSYNGEIFLSAQNGTISQLYNLVSATLPYQMCGPLRSFDSQLLFSHNFRGFLFAVTNNLVVNISYHSLSGVPTYKTFTHSELPVSGAGTSVLAAVTLKKMSSDFAMLTTDGLYDTSFQDESKKLLVRSSHNISIDGRIGMALLRSPKSFTIIEPDLLLVIEENRTMEIRAINFTDGFVSTISLSMPLGLPMSITSNRRNRITIGHSKGLTVITVRTTLQSQDVIRITINMILAVILLFVVMILATIAITCYLRRSRYAAAPPTAKTSIEAVDKLPSNMQEFSNNQAGALRRSLLQQTYGVNYRLNYRPFAVEFLLSEDIEGEGPTFTYFRGTLNKARGWALQVVPNYTVREEHTELPIPLRTYLRRYYDISMRLGAPSHVAHPNIWTLLHRPSVLPVREKVPAPNKLRMDDLKPVIVPAEYEDTIMANDTQYALGPEKIQSYAKHILAHYISLGGDLQKLKQWKLIPDFFMDFKKHPMYDKVIREVNHIQTEIFESVEGDAYNAVLKAIYLRVLELGENLIPKPKKKKKVNNNKVRVPEYHNLTEFDTNPYQAN